MHLVQRLSDHFFFLVTQRGSWNIWDPQPMGVEAPTIPGRSIYANMQQFITKGDYEAVLNYLNNFRLCLIGNHSFRESISYRLIKKLQRDSWVFFEEEDPEPPAKWAKQGCRFCEGTGYLDPVKPWGRRTACAQCFNQTVKDKAEDKGTLHKKVDNEIVKVEANPDCVACGGTGVSSSQMRCFPCACWCKEQEAKKNEIADAMEKHAKSSQYADGLWLGDEVISETFQRPGIIEQVLDSGQVSVRFPGAEYNLLLWPKDLEMTGRNIHDEEDKSADRP